VAHFIFVIGALAFLFGANFFWIKSLYDEDYRIDDVDVVIAGYGSMGAGALVMLAAFILARKKSEEERRRH